MQSADLLDLALVIARTRAARESAGTKAKEECRKLEVGQSFSISIPDGQPGRRETVNAVNAAAWGILGPGRYTLTQSPAELTVTRIERKERPRLSPCAWNLQRGAQNAR
jgi:hypothetical protein